MRGIVVGTLATATPLLLAIGLVAAPKPRASPPVQIPLTGQAQDAAGNHFTLTGTLTLTTDVPAPIPVPPVAISYVTNSGGPLTVGGTGQVTVVLTRAPQQLLRLGVQIEGTSVSGPTFVDVPAGAATASFPVRVVATAIAQEERVAVHVTYNGQSPYTTLLLVPPVVPVPTPTPPPTPLLPVSPRIDGVTNPDGTPLTLPAEQEQPVKVKGAGFGPEAGEMWWQGFPIPVVSWSDTEALGTLPAPSAGIGIELRTKAGGFSGGMLTLEAAETAPPPPSSRRR